MHSVRTAVSKLMPDNDSFVGNMIDMLLECLAVSCVLCATEQASNMSVMCSMKLSLSNSSLLTPHAGSCFLTSRMHKQHQKAHSNQPEALLKKSWVDWMMSG